MTGSVRRETWRDPDPRQADFFTAKGVLKGLLDKLRIPWSVERGSQPFLHPGRAARIRARDVEVGWIGEIHPLVAAEWDLDRTVVAFQLDLDALGEPGTPMYEDLTSFPAVREDLSVVVPEGIASRQVVEVALEAAAPLLERAEVFDVYRDPERIGAGKVSLAIRLTYRAPDRTLTDEEVADRRQAIVEAVERRLDGSIRG
jgi:phenylalanyl-tRNA synthetase beta chain